MAISVIGSAGVASGTTSGSVNTTGADLLVVVQAGELDALGFTDNQGNSWTHLEQYGPGGGEDAFAVRISWCKPAGVSATHTITVNASAQPAAFLAFSGTHASPYHSENGGSTGGSSPRATGSVTPPVNGSLLIAGMVGDGTSNTYGISSPFTLGPTRDGVEFVNWGVASAYLIQETAGALNPSFSWSGGAPGECCIAVFLPAETGGGIPIAVAVHHQRHHNKAL